MVVFESKSLDVYKNLAIEEYLLEQVTDSGPLLFLWRSASAVVLGKNQNPWKECRLDRMSQDEVPLARRISGGGTVYHDAGNLNYCVMVDRVSYQEDRAFEMVMQALTSVGVQAERTGKSNLSVQGKKFSGNAFCFRKSRVMHHGTLLLNTDLNKLNYYLGSQFSDIKTAAIDSVPATVANLGVDMEKIQQALMTSFEKKYSDGAALKLQTDSVLGSEIGKYEKKQHSEMWRFGATPAFSIRFKGMYLEIQKGVVVRAEGEKVSHCVNKPFWKCLFL